MIGNSFTMQTHLAPIIELFPEYTQLNGVVSRTRKKIGMFGVDDNGGEFELDQAMPYSIVSKSIAALFPGKKWEMCTLEIYSKNYKKKGEDIITIVLYKDDKVVSSKTLT